MLCGGTPNLFGGDEEDPDLVLLDAVDDLDLLGQAHGAVEADALVLEERRQVLLLVLHQGEQRRHHDHQLVRAEVGHELVAQRLALARGNDEQRRLVAEDALDGLLLPLAEPAEAKVFLEHGVQLLRCDVFGCDD